jgi:hypothetical protein
MKIKITILSVGLFINLLNAQTSGHQLNVGIDTYSGDINSDFGVNVGYSYEWGEECKFALGVNVTSADGSNDTGDAISFNAKLGKEIFSNTTLYGVIGLTGMGTGLKNSSNKDVSAGGINYGLLVNYSLSTSYDLQFGYKGYDLEYKLDGKNEDIHINSASFGLVYKF